MELEDEISESVFVPKDEGESWRDIVVRVCPEVLRKWKVKGAPLLIVFAKSAEDCVRIFEFGCYAGLMGIGSLR